MLAHVRQRFLHDVQHLDLHVGRQRQALAVHVQRALEAGLVLELAQRGHERGLDVLGVGAGAKVHQQLAHVAVAFAHAQIDFAQHVLHLLRIAAGDGVAHELHLDFQESERLRDRVMQFARQKAALLRHGGLDAAGIEAQVFHRPGELRGERFEQRALGLRHLDLRVEEQINFAHQPLVQADRHRHHRFEAGLRAVAHACGLHGADRDHARARRRAGRAAMAVAGHEAMLGVDHGRWQTVRSQHQVAAVGLIRPAQRHTVGTGDARDVAREPGGQLVESDSPGDQVADLVEAFQPLVLFLELRGLFLDAAFEVAVHRLQLSGHVVEAGGQGAELVGGRALDARSQVTALNPVDRLLEQTHGLEHEQVAGVEQHRRTHHGQRHERDLQQVHQRRPASQVRFDASDEAVDVGDEGLGVSAQGDRAIGRRRSGNPAAKAGPVVLDGGETLAHRVIPRHEQRALRIAVAQQRQAAFELDHLRRQGLRVAGGRGQHHAIGLHAHATGLVDGGRAAFELERHRHQHGDGAQGQQQKRSGDQRELGTQGPVTNGAHRADHAPAGHGPDAPGAKPKRASAANAKLSGSKESPRDLLRRLEIQELGVPAGRCGRRELRGECCCRAGRWRVA